MKGPRLFQQSFLEEREFRITSTWLELKISDQKTERTSFLAFDRFLSKSNVYIKCQPKLLKNGLLANIVAMTIIILEPGADLLVACFQIACAGIFLVGWFFITRDKDCVLGLTNGQKLLLKENQKSRNGLDEFLRNFYQRRGEYFCRKYFWFDPGKQREPQLQRISWLKA